MNDSATEKIQDIETCSICIDRRPNARINPCEHKFCSKCIVRWSKKQTSCPICRQQFTQILTSRRAIAVKPIVNPTPRQIRRNPSQMGMNMILIPFPILNYGWGYSPYMMAPQFFFNSGQLSSPFLIPNFNMGLNQPSN